MEAKAKSGAPAPKAASKAEKKEQAVPRKADPAPAVPGPEHSPHQDGAPGAEAAAGCSLWHRLSGTPETLSHWWCCYCCRSHLAGNVATGKKKV
uniref:Uncharacterized protein n=1 Tax=Monopterus albus TaxID=43700 RepID=A0A3Q3R5R7_MONAL